MRIICVEGCHGCGKTTIIKELKSRGYNTLDENFLDMPKYGLAPQCFTIELLWVTKWIERILILKDIFPDDTMIYADRSPFSVLFYAPNGQMLEPMLNELIEDMLMQAGVEIYTVYIDLPRDVLWSQISNRLEKEPDRAKYNENQRSHMDAVVDFYESKKYLWTYTVSDPMAILKLYD